MLTLIIHNSKKRGTQQPSSAAAPRVVFYSVSESSLHTRMFQRTVPDFDFARYMNETGKSRVVLFRRNAVTIQTIRHLKEKNLRSL